MSNKLKAFLLVLITTIVIYIMNFSGKQLKTATTPLGIINLELAINVPQVITILDAWNNPKIHTAAKQNIYLDFIFILSYAGLIFFICRQLANRFLSKSNAEKISLFFSYAIIGAGILDVFENLGMLVSLSGNVNLGIIVFTLVSSILKWILVCFAVLWILITGGWLFVKSIFLEKNISNN